MNVRTRDVLKVIGAATLVVSAVTIPNLPIALMATYKAWQQFNKKDLGRIIKRLEKQEMISIKENGNKLSIEVTEKGKRRLLEYDIENIEIKSLKRDGKWRLIIFDIPEEKRNNRDTFRRKLLQLGCIRLQDSIFVCAYPCKNEVDFLCNYFEISDYVTLVVVDKIERGEQLIFKEFIDYPEDGYS